MNFISLILHIIILGAVKNYAASETESESTCKDDFCSSQNQSKRFVTYKISNSDGPQDFFFSNFTDLSDSEIHFVPTFNSRNPVNKIKIPIRFEQETTTDQELQVSSEESVPDLSTADKVEEREVSEITESGESTTKQFSSSTDKPKITENNVSTTSRTKVSTLEPTINLTNSFTSKNFKINESICFCDMHVNECDINCCCDEDCSPSHFKVFTKCIDNNAFYDLKYCYMNNFIFKNNSQQTVIQRNAGLFCIVKENAKVNLKYEAEEVFTDLESFKKHLPAKTYAFSYKSESKFRILNKNYVAESPVWSVHNGEAAPFKILHSSVGLLCNSALNIKYLVNEEEVCFYKQPQSQCGTTKVKEVLNQLRGIKIITSPTSTNQSEILNSSMICKTDRCIRIISFICLSTDNGPRCIRVLENSVDFENDCSNALTDIQYKIWHNGTEGILKMEAFLWIRKLPKNSNEVLLHLTTTVDYTWAGSTAAVFKRSGNPGYLTGRPILAGKKVFSNDDETFGKKEAIELSQNPKDWLTFLGSEKGICSSTERIPINFRENSKYMCSIKLSSYNFSKENCVELQNNIFKLLIGDEIINDAKENYFNKFVATFGNSRVEETGDWVQVLIDLFPISSSQVYFKPNHQYVACKNMITDLYIYIIYAKVGSFLAPQAKVLGVSFQLGKHRDLIFYCDTPGCENTALVRHFKLSSAVHFVDATKPALDAFAEPLSLDVKLPHDFFYPFFSKSCRSQFLNKFVLILFLSTLF